MSVFSNGGDVKVAIGGLCSLAQQMLNLNLRPPASDFKSAWGGLSHIHSEQQSEILHQLT